MSRGEDKCDQLKDVEQSIRTAVAIKHDVPLDRLREVLTGKVSQP